MPKILQIIPALPGTFATFKHHEPEQVHCWALMEPTPEEWADWGSPDESPEENRSIEPMIAGDDAGPLFEATGAETWEYLTVVINP